MQQNPNSYFLGQPQQAQGAPPVGYANGAVSLQDLYSSSMGGGQGSLGGGGGQGHSQYAAGGSSSGSIGVSGGGSGGADAFGSGPQIPVLNSVNYAPQQFSTQPPNQLQPLAYAYHQQQQQQQQQGLTLTNPAISVTSPSTQYQQHFQHHHQQQQQAAFATHVPPYQSAAAAGSYFAYQPQPYPQGMGVLHAHLYHQQHHPHLQQQQQQMFSAVAAAALQSFNNNNSISDRMSSTGADDGGGDGQGSQPGTRGPSLEPTPNRGNGGAQKSQGADPLGGALGDASSKVVTADGNINGTSRDNHPLLPEDTNDNNNNNNNNTNNKDSEGRGSNKSSADSSKQPHQVKAIPLSGGGLTLENATMSNVATTRINVVNDTNNNTNNNNNNDTIATAKSATSLTSTSLLTATTSTTNASSSNTTGAVLLPGQSSVGANSAISSTFHPTAGVMSMMPPLPTPSSGVVSVGVGYVTTNTTAAGLPNSTVGPSNSTPSLLSPNSAISVGGGGNGSLREGAAGGLATTAFLAQSQQAGLAPPSLLMSRGYQASHLHPHQAQPPRGAMQLSQQHADPNSNPAVNYSGAQQFYYSPAAPPTMGGGLVGNNLSGMATSSQNMMMMNSAASPGSSYAYNNYSTDNAGGVGLGLSGLGGSASNVSGVGGGAPAAGGGDLNATSTNTTAADEQTNNENSLAAASPSASQAHRVPVSSYQQQQQQTMAGGVAFGSIVGSGIVGSGAWSVNGVPSPMAGRYGTGSPSDAALAPPQRLSAIVHNAHHGGGGKLQQEGGQGTATRSDGNDMESSTNNRNTNTNNMYGAGGIIGGTAAGSISDMDSVIGQNAGMGSQQASSQFLVTSNAPAAGAGGSLLLPVHPYSQGMQQPNRAGAPPNAAPFHFNPQLMNPAMMMAPNAFHQTQAYNNAPPYQQQQFSYTTNPTQDHFMGSAPSYAAYGGLGQPSTLGLVHTAAPVPAPHSPAFLMNGSAPTAAQTSHRVNSSNSKLSGGAPTSSAASARRSSTAAATDDMASNKQQQQQDSQQNAGSAASASGVGAERERLDTSVLAVDPELVGDGVDAATFEDPQCMTPLPSSPPPGVGKARVVLLDETGKLREVIVNCTDTPSRHPAKVRAGATRFMFNPYRTAQTLNAEKIAAYEEQQKKIHLTSRLDEIGSGVEKESSSVEEREDASATTTAAGGGSMASGGAKAGLESQSPTAQLDDDDEDDDDVVAAADALAGSNSNDYSRTAEADAGTSRLYGRSTANNDNNDSIPFALATVKKTAVAVAGGRADRDVGSLGENVDGENAVSIVNPLGVSVSVMAVAGGSISLSGAQLPPQMMGTSPSAPATTASAAVPTTSAFSYTTAVANYQPSTAGAFSPTTSPPPPAEITPKYVKSSTQDNDNDDDGEGGKGQNALNAAALANGITEEVRNTTRGQIMYAAVRFKYTHGVYYIDEKIRVDIAVGDMVVVEGDRGTNIGMVMEDATADVLREIAEVEARAAKIRADLGLMEGGDASCSQMETSLATAETSMMTSNNPEVSTVSNATHTTATTNNNNNNHKRKSKHQNNALIPRPPKFLRVLHNSSNKDRKKFYQARRREGGAASIVQRIVEDLNLPIHVCDAEFQCDFQKLFVFYRVKHTEASNVTLDLRELQKDLFRQYRCRIWLLNWYTELSVHYPQALFGAAHGRQSIVNGVLEPPLVTAALRVPPPLGAAENTNNNNINTNNENEKDENGGKRSRGHNITASNDGSTSAGAVPHAHHAEGGATNKTLPSTTGQALRQAVNSGSHKSVARKGLVKTLVKPAAPFNPFTVPSPGGHVYPNAIVPPSPFPYGVSGVGLSSSSSASPSPMVYNYQQQQQQAHHGHPTAPMPLPLPSPPPGGYAFAAAPVPHHQQLQGGNVFPSASPQYHQVAPPTPQQQQQQPQYGYSASQSPTSPVYGYGGGGGPSSQFVNQQQANPNPSPFQPPLGQGHPQQQHFMQAPPPNANNYNNNNNNNYGGGGGGNYNNNTNTMLHSGAVFGYAQLLQQQQQPHHPHPVGGQGPAGYTAGGAQQFRGGPH